MGAVFMSASVAAVRVRIYWWASIVGLLICSLRARSRGESSGLLLSIAGSGRCLSAGDSR